MRPADLIAIAVPTAPKPATTPASTEDADAFARAMESESATVHPAGDGRCGVTPGQAEAADGQHPRTDRPDGDSDLVRPEGGQRPERAAVGEWRGFLQGLRDLGLLGGAARLDGEAAAGKLTLATALQAEAPSTPKPGPASADAFGAALAALSDAINAAVQDPAANPAQPGQLPAAVQTALDAAVAAAPVLLQPRVQAFGERLTQRLAAMLGGSAGDSEAQGDAASRAAAAADPARPARSVAQAVLAALDAGQTQAPVIPDLERRAPRADRAAAAPSATSSEPSPPAAAQATPAASTAQAGGSDAKSSATSAPAESAAQAAAEPVVAAAETAADSKTAGPAATSASASASSAAHAATLAATRGAPELVAQLAATIVRKLEGRTTHFNMELNPAELGRVDVRLSIDKDGRVAAQMAFDNPVAAADMRGRADELRRQLEQAGFQVAGEDLTFAEREKGQGFDRHARPETDPDAARERAFREGERTARLAEDAGRLANRAVIGLDMRV